MLSLLQPPRFFLQQLPATSTWTESKCIPHQVRDYVTEPELLRIRLGEHNLKAIWGPNLLKVTGTQRKLGQTQGRGFPMSQRRSLRHKRQNFLLNLCQQHHAGVLREATSSVQQSKSCLQSGCSQAGWGAWGGDLMKTSWVLKTNLQCSWSGGELWMGGFECKFLLGGKRSVSGGCCSTKNCAKASSW